MLTKVYTKTTGDFVVLEFNSKGLFAICRTEQANARNRFERELTGAKIDDRKIDRLKDVGQSKEQLDFTTIEYENKRFYLRNLNTQAEIKRINLTLTEAKTILYAN